MNEKSPLQSKMVWVGVITVTLSVLGAFQADTIIREYPLAVSITGLIIGLLTVVLRFITNQPIQPIAKLLKRNKNDNY